MNTITLDQLVRIAEDTPWEAFEAKVDGRLLLQDRAQTLLLEEESVNPLLWVFEMRVGLHFERPMQAIMSCGHFVRMRSAENWSNSQLRKLDPDHPDTCLYAEDNGFSRGPVSWRPLPVPETVWLAPNQYPPPPHHQALQRHAHQHIVTWSGTSSAPIPPGGLVSSNPNYNALCGFGPKI